MLKTAHIRVLLNEKTDTTREGERVMRKESIKLMFLLALLGLCVNVSQTEAQSFILRKVADQNTPIPGGSGNFTSFYFRLLVDGNNLVFASAPSGQQGIYLFNGDTLRVLADCNTEAPGSLGNFSGFEGWVMSGSNVAFLGSVGSGNGIYLFNGTALIKVADFNTPIPEGSGNFIHINAPAISGSSVVFEGFGSSGQRGIYLFNGTTLRKVVDFNTSIPEGSGNFTWFESPGISEGKVVFHAQGSSGQQGIYLSSGKTLSRITDRNTPIPGGAGNFLSLGFPLISGSNVAFIGGSYEQQGIYLFNGTILIQLADSNTPIPEGSGNFTWFESPGISEGKVVFHAQGSSGQQGIYLFNGTTLRKVADLNTAIPDGSEKFTLLSPPVISGGNVAFWGDTWSGQGGNYFFNGTALIKVADSNTPIPEGSGNFTTVSWPVISSANVAFFGNGEPAQQGIYLASLQFGSVIVPTMTEWGIIALIILLGIASFAISKNNG
jgi:hypothetical protein